MPVINLGYLGFDFITKCKKKLENASAVFYVSGNLLL